MCKGTAKQGKAAYPRSSEKPLCSHLRDKRKGAEPTGPRAWPGSRSCILKPRREQGYPDTGVTGPTGISEQNSSSFDSHPSAPSFQVKKLTAHIGPALACGPVATWCPSLSSTPGPLSSHPARVPRRLTALPKYSTDTTEALLDGSAQTAVQLWGLGEPSPA